MPKASLYLYVKTEAGWRYKKPARGGNGKVIPQAVLNTAGAVEVHPEGKYYFNQNGQWIPAGNNAQFAVEKLKLLNAQKGTTAAAPAPAAEKTDTGTQMALEAAQKAYLAHMELRIASGSIKQATYRSANSITSEFLKWMSENTSHARPRRGVDL